MTKEFDLLIFICRAQPLHRGHELVIQQALEKSERVLVLVGSANVARSIRNPFTYNERHDMIEASFHSDMGWKERLYVEPLNDYATDTAWIAAVQKKVEQHQSLTGRIGLVGFAKDHTSYYLKMFPEWGSLNIESQYSTFNSTDIRTQYFKSLPLLPSSACSKHVLDYLEKFMYTEQFKWLVNEARLIHEYKASWYNSPFPPTFVTVDAVVVQSGHVLLIERGGDQGIGQIALPGGFINVKETLLESVLRELREETRISDGRGEIPAGVLQSFITKSEVFDSPDRSTRGRTITHAYLFELPAKNKLYKVRGGDDARAANWYKIGTVPSTSFFEDHYFIMSKMLGLTME